MQKREIWKVLVLGLISLFMVAHTLVYNYCH